MQKYLMLLALVAFGPLAETNAIPANAPAPPVRASPTIAAPASPAPFVLSAPGTANCNCTDADADLTVCQQSSVGVTYGGNPFQVTTGASTSTCAGQSVAPGQCIYYLYVFRCTYSFWDGLVCSLHSAGLHARDATDKDCNSDA